MSSFTMTVLEAVALLEAAVLKCKKREVDTPELRGALDLLEPYIRPAWLIPQFPHNLDGERPRILNPGRSTAAFFRATFPGIRDSVRELLGRKIDALATLG